LENFKIVTLLAKTVLGRLANPRCSKNSFLVAHS
jgi:hypothetical protein